MRAKFGPCDYESASLYFTHTDYYQQEFGSGLKKAFVSFTRLIPPQRLSRIKIITNKIEERLSRDGKRRVNIDPGYLDLSKVILATTKDFSHRIYLAGGIYAEVTLFYQAGGFKAWPWTYPDYQTDEYIEIFNLIRGLYAQQIKGR